MTTTYIQVCKIDSTEYTVEVNEGEGGQIDSSYKTAAAAEKRAEKLSKELGCDWGADY
jgi:hypothetical protein